jgi:DNA-binding protein H-NS
MAEKHGESGAARRSMTKKLKSEDSIYVLRGVLFLPIVTAAQRLKLLNESQTWHSQAHFPKGDHMATLKQIRSRIEKLQAQAEALLAKRASVVIADIRARMEKHGLTTADIDAYAPRGKQRGSRKAAVSTAKGKAKDAAKAKGKLPPKYRNPETGETWSGHARPPAWIKDAQDRSVFLIGGAAAGAAKTTAAKKFGKSRTAAKKAVAAKKAAPKKTAAKAVKRAARKSGARQAAAAAAATE